MDKYVSHFMMPVNSHIHESGHVSTIKITPTFYQTIESTDAKFIVLSKRSFKNHVTD